MLAAREVLSLTSKWVDKFSANNGAGNAVHEEVVQTQYIAIVCMMRAVGHVLQKVDCEPSQSRKVALQAKWKAWKQEPIFADFIEPTRNRLLKEFEGGLELIGQEGATQAVAAGPQPQRHWWFDASKVKDSEGRPVLAKFREALAFWNRALSEIESVPE
jgi:hypothetical protein